MTKLFYGSYGACALLALFQLVMFLSTYSRGDIAIYNGVMLVMAGATSLSLLASIFFPLKAKIIALLIFAVATISGYVWDISAWPSDSPAFRTGVLLIILVPILGLVSSASLLTKEAKNKDQA